MKGWRVFRRPQKCHIMKTAERLQTFELSLNPIYNILDFQLFSNPMISCCLGRALARTGFTLVMTSTECTPRIAKKRWWSTIRRIIMSRNDHFIKIIHSWHTSNLSRVPRVYPCKKILAGVNFYRFNTKNWQFSVYFNIIKIR